MDELQDQTIEFMSTFSKKKQKEEPTTTSDNKKDLKNSIDDGERGGGFRLKDIP